MALPVIRGVTEKKGTTTASRKVPWTTGSAAKDGALLIAVARTEKSLTFTGPSGWILKEEKVVSSGTTRRVIAVWTKASVTSEEVAAEVTVSMAEAVTSMSATLVVVTQPANSEWFSQFVAIATEEEKTAKFIGATPTGPESLVLSYCSASVALEGIPPSEWTLQSNGAEYAGVLISRTTPPAAGESSGSPKVNKAGGGTSTTATCAFVLVGVTIEVKTHGGGLTKVSSEAVHLSEPKVHGGGRTAVTSYVAGETRVAVHGGGLTKVVGEARHSAEVKVTSGGETRVLGERAPNEGLPEIVQRGESGSGASSVKFGQNAVAGNLLVAFYTQASTTPPSVITDNLGGSWTISPTKAEYQGGVEGLFIAWKRAVGGEKEVKATPPEGVLAGGWAYFEVHRLSETIDTIAVVNQQKSTGSTFSGFGTTNALDMILAAWGVNPVSGAVAPWTGTGPLSLVSSATTRVVAGSLVPEAVVSSGTFAAHWTSTTNNGGIIVAFLAAGVVKVPGGGKTTVVSYVVNGSGTIKQSSQGDVSVVGEPAVGVSLVKVTGGGRTRVEGAKGQETSTAPTRTVLMGPVTRIVFVTKNQTQTKLVAPSARTVLRGG